MTYRSELDGLRALAALMVVFCHSGFAPFVGGQQGVDVFFVLSGYLITSLLPGQSLGEFYWRRALRLYPALLALCAVYLAASPLLRWPVIDAVQAVTYTRNLFIAPGTPATPLKHTWSLALEAQFYLVWPFILSLVDRLDRRRFLLTAWVALTVARALYAASAGPDLAFLSQPLHVTGLLLGAACAGAPRLPGWTAWVGAALIGGHLAASAAGVHSIAFGLPAVEAGTALIVCATAGRLHRALSWSPLVGLGLISYGVYLWHAPAAFLMAGQPWPQVLVVALAAGIGFGGLSYMTVERVRRRPARLAPAE